MVATMCSPAGKKLIAPAVLLTNVTKLGVVQFSIATSLGFGRVEGSVTSNFDVRDLKTVVLRLICDLKT